MKVGDMVRHVHRSMPGEVLAIAQGWAMVKWPDWRRPDLCEVRDLWPA